MDNQDVNKARPGRPTDYCSRVAETVCTKIANGQTLRKICKLDSMPSVRTVMRWLIRHEEFCQQYREAREIQADMLFDELLDIADEANPETVNLARLRIWARQWLIGKINPRKYGDKSPDLTISNTVNNLTITQEKLAEIQEARRIALERN